MSLWASANEKTQFTRRGWLMSSSGWNCREKTAPTKWHPLTYSHRVLESEDAGWSCKGVGWLSLCEFDSEPDLPICCLIVMLLCNDSKYNCVPAQNPVRPSETLSPKTVLTIILLPSIPPYFHFVILGRR